MAENSKIEWTDHTFNPWIGCTKVSPACDHCYAERDMANRLRVVQWGAGNPRKRTGSANWRAPLRWNEQAKREGRRYRVFCASLADVFDNEVPVQWRVELLALIAATPALDWLLLTKRIGNARAMLNDSPACVRWDLAPLPNVWLGATVVNQDEADRDIRKLLATPAAVRFLSMEPLLGPVDLTNVPLGGGHGLHEFSPIITGNALKRVDSADPRIDWIIVGGESGPHARPMHPAWVRSLRDQCAAAGVPFHFKQHGEWLATTFCDDDMAMLPSKRTAYVEIDGTYCDTGFMNFFGGAEETAWVGKKAAGRVLDGKTWDGVPGAQAAPKGEA